jgi:TolB protein
MKFIQFIGTLVCVTILLAACTTANPEPTPAVSPGKGMQSNPDIAYFAGRQGRGDLYVLDLETRQETRLTAGLDLVQDEFEWSPDGTSIVFVNGVEYEESELFVVNVYSGEIRQLTDNQTMDKSPAWSPNGEWIAFQSGLNTRYDSKIWVINPNSLEKRSISEEFFDKEGYHFVAPVWSLDSMMIATRVPYSLYDHKIYFFDFPSGQLSQIIGPEQTDTKSLIWSPDERMIAYVRNTKGSSDSYDIYMQEWPASTDQQIVQLTDLPGAEGWLQWSPENDAILFMNAQQENVSDNWGPSHIYTVDLDSMKIQRLTDAGSNYYNYTPSWSPDGSKIAFGTARDGFEYIAVMDRDGSELEVLEETKSDAVWAPKWSPLAEP